MTPLLQEQLEIVLRDEYRVLRELGGGGMSRVFLAEDVALGRKVVIKVLTPELAAGVNRERFQREIKLLATLQHPLLVPVLAAGEGDGLVWYSMPFVEGESLRERLRRGAVPVREALAIVIDVAQGLAEAHRRGVVHRDVKPENILLSGGRAVVADFGIAKALSDATTAQAGLTASGIAVGTPAYMAPEQATGDPDVDARADVYALGCVAYELLSGTPPFEAPTPSQLLMAQVVQAPEPLLARAPQVGAAVSDVVMRALAKPAAERWQSASAFAEALEEARYGAPQATPARTTPAAADASPTGDWARVRVVLAGLWIVALVLAAIAVVAVHTGWAPRWTRGIAVLMAAAATVVAVAGPGRLTLGGARRFVRGSAAAYGVLVAAVIGEGALRAAGVGPFASLISSGRLAERDRVLVAEFANRTGDATLGDLVTDALRTDLAQSRSVTVVPHSDVVAALARMQRPGAVLDSALALDLAQREGVPAVLLGTIARLGGTVVISTRLVTRDGDELAGFREVAEGDDDVIAAVDRLSKAMRGRVGESLRSVAASPPLEEVTTGSLEALRKYTAALRVAEKPGKDAFTQEIALLEEAVRLDSTFAMAWRRLGVRLYSSGADPVRGNAALTRAFRYRDKLTPVERSLAEAGYYTYVVPDAARQAAAYAAVLAADSGNRIALNNVTRRAFEDGRWPEALAAARRFVASDSANANAWTWYLGALWALGRDAEYRRGWETLQRREGGVPDRLAGPVIKELQATGRWREVGPYVDSVAPRISDPAFAAGLQVMAASSEMLVGRLAPGERRLATAYGVLATGDTALRRRTTGLPLRLRFLEALWLQGDTAAARRALADYVRTAGVEAWAMHERGVANLAFDFAVLGDATTARRRLEAYWAARRTAGLDTARFVAPGSAFALALEALVLQAERRPVEALARWRQLADSAEGADVVSAGFIGFAYRQAGQRDSALAAFRRWVEVRDPRSFSFDQNYYLTPRVLREGCELADEVGDVAARRLFCGRLVALWRDADPVLRPQVEAARARLSREAGRPVGR